MLALQHKTGFLMVTHNQGPSPKKAVFGTRQWEDLTVEEQDHLLLASFEGNEQRWNIAEALDVKSGTADTIFTQVYLPGYPAENDEQRRQRERVSLQVNKGSNLAARLTRAIDRRDLQRVLGPEPPITGMVSQPVSDPNCLSYEDTMEAFQKGKIGFFVDRGRAVQAVASGVPIGTAGLLTAITMPAAIVIGIAMAIFVAWWWLFVGAAVAVGTFRFSRMQAVNAVRHEAMRNERLFYALRKSGVIWFESAK